MGVQVNTNAPDAKYHCNVQWQILWDHNIIITIQYQAVLNAYCDVTIFLNQI